MKKLVSSLIALTCTCSCLAPLAGSAYPMSDYEGMSDREAAISIVSTTTGTLNHSIDITKYPLKSPFDETIDKLIDVVDIIDDIKGYYETYKEFKEYKERFEEYLAKRTSIDISREYVPEDLDHAAYITMTKKDYEDLTAHPDTYDLYFIEGEPVLVRDGIVLGLENFVPEVPGDVIEVPIYVGCEVMKRLDGVFFAVNTRNEALAQIDDFMTLHGYWNIVDDETEILPSRKYYRIYNSRSGNDTYRIKKGSGFVYIRDYCDNNSGDADKMVIDYDLEKTKLHFHREGNDLYIYDEGNDTLIFVENYFDNCRIEYIQLTDDITLTYADVCKIVNVVKGTDEDDELNAYPESTVVYGYKGSDIITAKGGDEYYIFADEGDDVITASDGSDIILCGSGDDAVTITGEGKRLYSAENPVSNVILGGEGNDTITTTGNNIIVGGEGDDTINSGFGDDVFVYYKGDGNDKITDSINAFSNGGTDIVYFADLVPDDIYVRRDNGFTFYLNDGSGSVNIPGTYQNGASKHKEPIEYIVFSDDTVWNLHDVLDQSRRIENSTEFSGRDDLGYIITGTDGDDTFKTGSGDDIIRAGKGNDFISAGGGTDTIIFCRGDGHDVFDEDGRGSYPPGGEDTVLFEDINSDEVRIAQLGATITIKVNDSDDAVELPGIYYTGMSGPLHPIEKAQFADGVVWTFDEMLAMARIEATDGDDTFSIRDETHVLVCGKGNDNIRGYEVDDIYLYELGDGHDVIVDGSIWGKSYDTICFGEGINPNELNVKIEDNTIVISIPDTEDSVTITKGQIECFKFANGKVWGEVNLIEQSTATNILGDLNCDGSVSIADAVVMRNCLLGSRNVTVMKNADINEDGIFNVYDFIALKKLIIAAAEENAE